MHIKVIICNFSNKRVPTMQTTNIIKYIASDCYVGLGHASVTSLCEVSCVRACYYSHSRNGVYTKKGLICLIFDLHISVTF